MDRLSELPDSLIHHIFSFLHMKDIVRTTILSKQWVDLWTTVPYLSYELKSGNVDKFRDFINRTMMLWKGTKIQKFSVMSAFLSKSFHQDEKSWIRLAVQHKVEELYLCYLRQDAAYCLPQCLNSSSSIKKLCLNRAVIIFHGKINWDQLKSLRIDSFNVDQSVINNVLLGSPQLEILELCCGQNVNISSASLKELSLDYLAEDYYLKAGADKIDTELHIWTPNLEVLKIEGTVCTESLFLSVPSLIEAILTFDHPAFLFDEIPSDYESDGDMLRVVFQGIDHVEKLVLGHWFIEVLQVMKKTALPSPLLNLKRLTVDTCIGNGSLAGIVNLLEISPNVTMLTIRNTDDADWDDEENGDNKEELEDKWSRLLESPIPEVELSDSFLMNLRILYIELYSSASVFSLAKFVLKNANALEKIVIKGSALVGEMHKLLRMPGYPTNAEVVLR